MGIYDRDYYREERRGLRLGLPRSMTATLILINAVVWVVCYVVLDVSETKITSYLGASVGTLTHPLFWWQFLTYGFIHAKENVAHIVFNMVALWFFGRSVEQCYGAKEFLRLYLVLLVFGSVVWAAMGKFAEGTPDEVTLIGASGAVIGIVILFALNYPRVQVLLFFVFPVPAWALGVLYVAQDLWGAVHRETSSQIAYTVHLSGAAFALLYYQFRWNLGRPGTILRMVAGRVPWPWLKRRPRLRIHAPEDEDKRLSEEVDRILAKISLEGEASLSAKERRTLKNASRRFQERRRAGDDPED